MTKLTYTNSLARLSIAAFFVFCSSLFGGYVYQFENAGDSSQNVTLMVQGDRLRFSSNDNQGADMIFDASKSTMIILEHDRKRYMALDKETIAGLAAQIEEAMAEMEQQLASLPPAQRQMMENMMKGKMKGIGEALPELSFKRTGDSDTISGYEVEKVVLAKDGVAASELWVAEWETVEGSDELMASFKAMGDMYKDMMKAFSQGPMASFVGANAGSNWFGQIEDIGGMPIVSIELNASGQETSRTILTKAESQEIEASSFEIPKGYKKQKM